MLRNSATSLTVDEIDGDALLAEATRATDAVQIDRHVTRQVES
jgi:hypothetical protein